MCWQLPIKVDWEPGPGDTEVATVRRWTRADWGEDGDADGVVLHRGRPGLRRRAPVLDSLADEIEAIVGTAVHVELRRHVRIRGG